MNIKQSKQHYRIQNEWLDTIHHFSFGEYYDPNNTDFGLLRVFNDDIIKEGAGFPFHQHKDMEIITYVIEGSLLHKDTMGNKGTIEQGEVQRMSAGTGVFHSEYNNSTSKPLRLLQMWVNPIKKNLMPSWEQKKFTTKARLNKLLPIVDSKNQDSLSINQDVSFYVSRIENKIEIEYDVSQGRQAYLYVIDGEILVNDKIVKTRDSVKFTNDEKIRIKGILPSEIILIDLPSLL